MDGIRKEGNRFYVEMPVNNEISFAKLQAKYYEESQTSQSSVIEIPDEYTDKIKNLIARGENFGISSKQYKYVHSDSESDDSDSYSSSFIEKQTEASYFSSDEFETALDEGFYVAKLQEIQTSNRLKRPRGEIFEIPGKITMIIEEIKKIAGGRKLSWIPKKIHDFLLEIEETIKELDDTEKLNIHKEIAQNIGVSCKQIEKEILKSGHLRKRKSSLQTIKSLSSHIKKTWSELSKKLWNQDLEVLYQQAIEELKNYIEISKNLGKILDLDAEKERLNSKLKKQGISREGFGSQPIQII